MYFTYRLSTHCCQQKLKTMRRLLSTMSQTMNCWQINDYSKQLSETTLTLNNECLKPVIKKPTEMLIKVLSSSVNPIDIAMCSGYGNSLLSVLQNTIDLGIDSFTFDRLPLILGRDFCGVVVDCGQAVNQYRIGDSVWGALPPFARQGSHSQLIVADENHLCRKPSNLSAIESASIPYVGLTAWAAIHTIGSLNERNALGKRALVLGGSGGVGTFAIQLLKSWGTNVTTTCSGDAIDFVYNNTGADYCIDYNTNELDSSLDTFDFVLDAASGGKHIENISEIKYLRKGSKYVTLTTPLIKNMDKFGLLGGSLLSTIAATKQTIDSNKEGKSIRWAFYRPDSNALKIITDLVEKSLISAVIEKTFTFNELPKAFMKLSDGHSRGKIVIDFTQNNI